MYFSETIDVYDLKPTTDDRSDKKFLLTSNLCHLGSGGGGGGLYIPCAGYVYVLNHEKKKKKKKE